MDFRSILDVFSRRPEAAKKPKHDIPESTRNRVFFWCNDIFSNRQNLGFGDLRQDFWAEIHRRLQYRHGKAFLHSDSHASAVDDTLSFLLKCSGEEFLDFLEYIFRVQCFFHVAGARLELVSELNQLLRLTICLTTSRASWRKSCGGLFTHIHFAAE